MLHALHSFIVNHRLYQNTSVTYLLSRYLLQKDFHVACITTSYVHAKPSLRVYSII